MSGKKLHFMFSKAAVEEVSHRKYKEKEKKMV